MAATEITRRRMLALTGGAMMGMTAVPPPVLAEPPRQLHLMHLKTGRRFVPLMAVIGPGTKVTRRTRDLALPEAPISVNQFPASLAAFTAFDATGDGLLTKREAILAWAVLTARWRSGEGFGPGSLHMPDTAGRLAPVGHVMLPQAERRFLSAAARRTRAGHAAIRDTHVFLRGQIWLGNGPVWIDGYRQGGMESGGGGARSSGR